MRRSDFHRLVLASTIAGLGACGDARHTPAATVADRRPASEQTQQVTGLSHLPRPASPAALTRSLARHYPRERASVRPRTLVLMDVQLDEQGRVLDATPVDRPATAPSTVSMVLLDEVPGSGTPVERAYEAAYDQSFGPAARRALREVRFQPALRDGRPVPYTLRMTVEFTFPGTPS